MSNLPGCHGVMSSWMCFGKVCTWRAAKRDDGDCKSPKAYKRQLSLKNYMLKCCIARIHCIQCNFISVRGSYLGTINNCLLFSVEKCYTYCDIPALYMQPSKMMEREQKPKRLYSATFFDVILYGTAFSGEMLYCDISVVKLYKQSLYLRTSKERWRRVQKPKRLYSTTFFAGFLYGTALSKQPMLWSDNSVL